LSADVRLITSFSLIDALEVLHPSARGRQGGKDWQWQRSDCLRGGVDLPSEAMTTGFHSIYKSRASRRVHMFNLRCISTVKYGLFRDFLEANEVLDNLCRERGWATARFLVPVVGGGNEFVAEYEYLDLATFQTESNAQMSDPDYIKIFRGTADLIHAQSARTDL
jgi:hypothetical protein